MISTTQLLESSLGRARPLPVSSSIAISGQYQSPLMPFINSLVAGGVSVSASIPITEVLSRTSEVPVRSKTSRGSPICRRPT